MINEKGFTTEQDRTKYTKGWNRTQISSQNGTQIGI